MLQAKTLRRKREGKTDYRTRLKLLSSGMPRVVIRRTLNSMVAQLIAFDPLGDRVLVTATPHELRKHGWSSGVGNTPASYLTGLLLGRKALEKGVRDAVFDRGKRSGERVYAALKGVVDAGLNVPHSPEIFPHEDRVAGKHVKHEKEWEEARKRILVR